MYEKFSLGSFIGHNLTKSVKQAVNMNLWKAIYGRCYRFVSAKIFRQKESVSNFIGQQLSDFHLIIQISLCYARSFCCTKPVLFYHWVSLKLFQCIQWTLSNQWTSKHMLTNRFQNQKFTHNQRAVIWLRSLRVTMRMFGEEIAILQEKQKHHQIIGSKRVEQNSQLGPFSDSLPTSIVRVSIKADSRALF